MSVISWAVLGSIFIIGDAADNCISITQEADDIVVSGLGADDSALEASILGPLDRAGFERQNFF